jgi:hypothetical protein
MHFCSFERSFATLNCVDCNIVQTFEPYVNMFCQNPSNESVKVDDIAKIFNRQNLVSQLLNI